MSVPTVSQTKRSWESWYPWWQPDEEIGATLTVTAYGDIACAELADQESLLPVEESSKMRQELGSWLQSQVVLTPSMLDEKPIPVRISATIRIEKKRVTLKIGA